MSFRLGYKFLIRSVRLCVLFTNKPICYELGIPQTTDNHRAFSWLKWPVVSKLLLATCSAECTPWPSLLEPVTISKKNTGLHGFGGDQLILLLFHPYFHDAEAVDGPSLWSERLTADGKPRNQCSKLKFWWAYAKLPNAHLDYIDTSKTCTTNLSHHATRKLQQGEFVNTCWD